MKHVFIQLVNNALAGVISQCFKGVFHLHLLVFPFVYQFNSRIGVLVKDFQAFRIGLVRRLTSAEFAFLFMVLNLMYYRFLF